MSLLVQTQTSYPYALLETVPKCYKQNGQRTTATSQTSKRRPSWVEVFLGKATFLELVSVQDNEMQRRSKRLGFQIVINFRRLNFFSPESYTPTSNSAIKQKNPKTSYPAER